MSEWRSHSDRKLRNNDGIESSASRNGMARRHCCCRHDLSQRCYWPVLLLVLAGAGCGRCGRDRTRLARSSLVEQTSPSMDHTSDFDPLGARLDRTPYLVLSACSDTAVVRSASGIFLWLHHALAGGLAESPRCSLDFGTALPEPMEQW